MTDTNKDKPPASAPANASAAAPTPSSAAGAGAAASPAGSPPPLPSGSPAHPVPPRASAPLPGTISAPVTQPMVMETLKPIEDPEIHLGIVDLGLVYGADVSPDGKNVKVRMTLTSPACPYGPMLVDQVKLLTGQMPGVEKAEVEVVWEPPWDPRTMASDYVKDVLGIW